VVFGGAVEDPVDKIGLEEGAFDDGVVGLGAAAGEDEFGGVGIDQMGDLGARCFNSDAGFATKAVDAGGVAITVAEPWEHGVEDTVVDARGGAVVEVDQRPNPLYTSNLAL
jgi:hypothetical protein